MKTQSIVDYLTEEQRAIAHQLVSCIDPCEFRTVKQYFRSSRNEITHVVLVQPGYRLEEVGAVMTGGGVPQFSVMLALGAARLGIDHVASVQENKHLFSLDSVADKSLCHVLYLPPAYVVQLDAYD